MQLNSGHILNNRYKVLDVLGQGGFGITYLAYDTKENRHVAVKEFFFKDCCERDTDGHTVVVNTTSKKDLTERFRIKFVKEANLIKNLDHPNIVNVYDVFTENSTSYYIMEYIEGDTLSDIIKANGHLSESESLSIVDHIADALEYLHSRKINHLDIKPGNIMVSRHDKKITLIDFGVSKQYDLESGEATTTTPIGMSHGYSPLEQYRAGGVGMFTPESDIYALGATLFKMLSGVTPPNAVDIAHNGITDFPPVISYNMRKALYIIMSPDRSNRPHSIEDFRRTLKGQPISNTTVVAQEGATVVARNSTTRDNRPLLYTILAVMLCLIAGLGVYIVKNSYKHQRQAIPAVAADSIQEDSTLIEPIPQFTTNRLSKSVGKSSMKIDFPECANVVLKQNILEWINEQLGGTYEGDINDNDAMFNHYAADLNTIDDGYGQFSRIALTKAYEDDYVVTYLDDSEFYEGGAHGMGLDSGKTFRKSDGKVFNNSFISFYKLKDYAIRGLKKYFDVSSDDELLEQLLIGDNSLETLPPPSVDPWIMGDGVHFTYTPYEIAPYSAGCPSFTISIENIKPAVNATAKTFFE